MAKRDIPRKVREAARELAKDVAPRRVLHEDSEIMNQWKKDKKK